MSCKRVEMFLPNKKLISWCDKLEDFDVLHKIQPVMIWLVVKWMVCCTLRCQRERERRWSAQREREQVVERQCLERREPEPCGNPETIVFLPR